MCRTSAVIALAATVDVRLLCLLNRYNPSIAPNGADCTSAQSSLEDVYVHDEEAKNQVAQLLGKFHIRLLRTKDIPQAVALDAYWFGSEGVQEQDLTPLANSSDRALTLFEGTAFRGFATFEVVEPGSLPSRYIGMPFQERALFIQQFTTDDNYSGDMGADRRLLEAVEGRAVALGCAVVAEALDQNHAFSKERSIAERGEQHDAFGFYEQQGYVTDKSTAWTWQAEGIPEVRCLLYTKELTKRVLSPCEA